MTNPDLSAAAFSEFASRHTFDEIFDGRATPSAAVVPADAARIALEHAKTRFACLVDHFKEHGEEALCVMSEVDGERMDRGLAAVTSGTGAAEPDALVDLVSRFSAALLEKLRYARDIKGRSGWDETNWMRDCQRALLSHIPKGDALDVAAYAAFCWHHGWSTALSEKCPLCAGEGILPPDGGGCEKCGGSGRAALPPVRGDREAIARIIDRGAFEEHYCSMYPDRSTIEQYEAFKKADAILALHSAPVKKYAGNHSVALQFLFENETDGCPNCRGCAEHRCSSASSASEAAVSVDRAVALLKRGFMTACSGDSQYQIKIDFETLDEMQAAHTAFAGAFK